MTNKKPTRTDLLRVIGRLHKLVGGASSALSDRNPNRMAQITVALKTAESLCSAVTSFDKHGLSEPNGKGWGDDSKDIEWKAAT